MANKMLIDATHPEETRVVVLRGNRVEEFDFESASRRQLRGNIYLAKVTRVEPSLQAAFIDYGGNRHGFLAFSEIHPDYYQIPVADRQALIYEEERAHRDAEAEADRRAGMRRRPPRRQAAGRHSETVASEPIGDDLVEHDSEATANEPGDAPSDIHADADRRVELVTRQYEWAVNDIANLRDALRRSQTRGAGERWAQELKRESRPVRRVAVPLTSSIYAEGSLTSVRFEARETVPTQIRIVDERGTVVAISGRIVEPGSSSFVLRISERTADSLLHPDDSSLRIEGLVDDHWHAADLRGPGESSPSREIEAQVQPALSADKRGRVWSSPS